MFIVVLNCSNLRLGIQEQQTKQSATKQNKQPSLVGNAAAPPVFTLQKVGTHAGTSNNSLSPGVQESNVLTPDEE